MQKIIVISVLYGKGEVTEMTHYTFTVSYGELKIIYPYETLMDESDIKEIYKK